MDREKVVNGLEELKEKIRTATMYTFTSGGVCAQSMKRIDNAIELLKEQQKQIEIQKENFAFLAARQQPQIVRCKDCIHRGKAEKCVLTAISEEKDYPLFILDNRGNWFCADGRRLE